jgi:hypothetical protein
LAPRQRDRFLKIQRPVARKRIVVHIHDPHHQRTPGKLNDPLGQPQSHGVLGNCRAGKEQSAKPEKRRLIRGVT